MANASLSPRYWNISVYKYSPVRTVIHHLSLTSHKTKISSELCQSTSSCWRWISHTGNGEKRYLSNFFCIFNLIFIVMVKVLLSLTGNRQATDNLVLQRQTPSFLVAQKLFKLVKMENKIFPHIFRTHRTLILEILYALFRKWWVRRKRYGREKNFQGKRCPRVPNQILKDCSKTAQTFKYILVYWTLEKVHGAKWWINQILSQEDELKISTFKPTEIVTVALTEGIYTCFFFLICLSFILIFKKNHIWWNMITQLIALEEDVLDEIFEQPTKATQKQRTGIH